MVLVLSGCSISQDKWDYLKAKLGIRPAHLGYPTIVLKEGILPEVEIEFPSGEADLADADKVSLLRLAGRQGRFVIEGTAGGTSKNSHYLAKQRAINTAKFLETQGIKTDDIAIAEYDPNKPGRTVLIYTITY